MELWQILLGIALFLAAFTFVYPFVLWMKRIKGEREQKEERKEEVIKIIRELKELKEKIEKEGVELTALSDLFLVSVQTLFEIRGVNERIKETKTIIWFGLGTLLALCLAILSSL